MMATGRGVLRRNLNQKTTIRFAGFIVFGSILFITLGVVFRGPWGAHRQEPAPPQTPVSDLRHKESGAELAKRFIKKYCFECHATNEPAGDLSLRSLMAADSMIAEKELWDQVLQTVADREMPPAIHNNLPSAFEIKDVLSVLGNSAEPTTTAQPRTSTLHRLNHDEYENTLRDLFQLDAPLFVSPNHLVLDDRYFQPASKKMPKYVMAFSYHEWAHRHPNSLRGLDRTPCDPPVEHGFNNNKSSLSLSPLQLERQIQLIDSLLNHSELHHQSKIYSDLFETSFSESQLQLLQGRNQLDLFLTRAFRRPVNEVSRKRWHALFEQQLTQHHCYTIAMKNTVKAVLLSPRFLFREDRIALDEKRFDDWTIASRLSYFLWGSMPDDTLLNLALRGRLKHPQVVRKQVRRMLEDPRSRWLSTSFGMQWLQTLRAVEARPDEDQFGFFYDCPSALPSVSMAIEQMLLFETILVENRSILDFIDADYGYLNQVLMKWYGLNPNELIGFVPGPEDTEDFFRIQWPDRTRGGVICSGATMVSTSTRLRTSPVYRGAWILEVLFNRPPPPPPANTPALADHAHDGTVPLDIRERLAEHRRNPNCAACHDRMDPPGFALENYDVVGQFRSHLKDGSEVDTRGTILGREINGIAELKDAIFKEPEGFTQSLAENLLEFSLGRSLTVADEPQVQAIQAAAKKHDLAFQKIIEEVAVQSTTLTHSKNGASRQLVARPKSHHR